MSKRRSLKPVEIIWVDAHGGGIDWGKAATELDHKPDQVRTVGLLQKHDEIGATVVLSITQRGHSDAYIFIPAGCIVSVTEL